MAKALDGTHSLPHVSTIATPSLRMLGALRLLIGTGIVLGSAISLIGTSWDIQWHSFVGRDRTLIPPHLLMLTGITLGGLLALASVIIETFLVKRNPQLAKYSTNFAGLFSSSLGAYVAGFAALNAAIAFPLDSYWHALYGIDVAIWAPFHVMILSGMAIMPLGGAYMLASSAQLASRAGNQRGVAWGRIATIVALSAMMGVFTLMLSDALDQDNIFFLNMGVGISLFPLLAGLLTAYTFTTAKYALPYRASATYIMLVYIAFALIFAAFVPTATNALVVSEGLHYRRNITDFAFLSVVTMVAWPLMPIIVAPLSDICFSLGKRLHWSERKQGVGLALLALLACIPVFALEPLKMLETVDILGITGALLSLCIGIIGVYIGSRLGRYTGDVMYQEER